ncbi:hypothetical protein BDV36DRAFT_231444 [Aspergillus pseudocaelatus]|uniref:Uncharacterized protein n=1 Tax=Aspergillus pseudocaelatus TaxID=1825620 RepID=A0ABQ6WZ51_9EURO|nr:hypothetical protein BDV36DRAFT_231444 [Aspergillus pseudocaelatus]
MSSSQLILGHGFFAPEDVQLASLIPNIEDIELDSLESVLPLQEKDYTVKKRDNLAATIQATDKTKFAAFLSRIFNLSSYRSSQTNLDVIAQTGNTYVLRKPTRWFNELCEKEEVQKWLQEQIEYGNQVYFVIGLYTIFDAAVSDNLERKLNLNGDISASVGDVAGLPVAPAVNVGLSSSHESTRGATHRCTLPGEQIYAVRLKKVVYHTWQTKDAKNARLAKHSHWRMASDNRSSAEENSEIVEVFLEGDSDEGEDDEALDASALSFSVLGE